MNETDRELCQRLVATAMEAYRTCPWICPWQGPGYFAATRHRGVRGAEIVGALAVAAGVVHRRDGPDRLLNALTHWRDRNPDWRDRWHINYGMRDGWNGDAVHAYNYETWPHKDQGGWHASPCARDYRLGYAIGRRCARLCGLPLPRRPERIVTPTRSREHIDEWLSRKTPTTKAAGRLLDGREWNEMPETAEVARA